MPWTRSSGAKMAAELRPRSWSYPVRDQGQIVGAVVTFFDITERRRADNALRLSEEKRFRALVEHNAEAVFIIDPGGVKSDLPASSVFRVTGAPASDWLGHSILDRGHSDNSTTLRRRWPHA